MLLDSQRWGLLSACCLMLALGLRVPIRCLVIPGDSFHPNPWKSHDSKEINPFRPCFHHIGIPGHVILDFQTMFVNALPYIQTRVEDVTHFQQFVIWKMGSSLGSIYHSSLLCFSSYPPSHPHSSSLVMHNDPKCSELPRPRPASHRCSWFYNLTQNTIFDYVVNDFQHKFGEDIFSEPMCAAISGFKFLLGMVKYDSDLPVHISWMLPPQYFSHFLSLAFSPELIIRCVITEEHISNCNV